MKRKSLILLAPLLLALLVAFKSDEPTGIPYPEFQAPSTYRQWRTSADGKVSICFALGKTTFAADEEITVRGIVRNNTDKALTLIRPFGDDFFTESTGLCIVGPTGHVKYVGPQKDYVLGSDAFIQVPPRSVVDGAFAVPKNFFPTLDQPGLYVIDYRYNSNGFPSETPPANLWKGYIDSNPVTLFVK